MGCNLKSENKMKYVDFKSELIELLQAACRDSIQHYKGELVNEHIYAFTIFGSPGCTSLGVSLSTLESLDHRNKKSPNFSNVAFFNQMNASEWEYLGPDDETFDKVNAYIDLFYDTLFDGEFDDLDIEALSKDEYNQIPNNFFKEITISTIIYLKENNCFSDSPFMSDVLLGLQFADPSLKEVTMMEEISSKINSSVWHENVMNNCNYLRSMAKPLPIP